jgi:hypothetical protein
MMKKILIAFVGSMILYACSKTSEDQFRTPTDPNPPTEDTLPQCDTVNMKYAANVVPILTSNCYGCHGTASNTGSNGIILQGYSNIQSYATSGTLIGVITHASGFPQMPKDAPMLSDCDINIIRSWIDNGAQDN